MSMHPDKNYFKEFKGDCNCWIETGTCYGDGITLAIQAGFTDIHSIDIVNVIPEWYKHELKYNTYIGDSAEVLSKILPGLKDKKIMFWLDAHSMLTEGEEENYPLKREIDAIRKSGITDATILIDDLLYMTNPILTRLSFDELKYSIQEINWSYKFKLLSNPFVKNILLAYL